MMATTNATYALGGQAPVQPLEGRVVAPREPLRGRPDSFELDAVLDAGRLQAASSTRAWVGPSLRGGADAGRGLCKRTGNHFRGRDALKPRWPAFHYSSTCYG